MAQEAVPVGMGGALAPLTPARDTMKVELASSLLLWACVQCVMIVAAGSRGATWREGEPAGEVQPKPSQGSSVLPVLALPSRTSLLWSPLSQETYH